MDFATTDDVALLRDEVRALLDEHVDDAMRDRVAETGSHHDWALHRAIARRGWLQAAVPGSSSANVSGDEVLSILFQAMQRAGAPYDGLSVTAMLIAILSHAGNEFQRKYIVPRLLSGDDIVALGYSEPEAGSDVAAVTTRASRDGDDWVIDGQKMFTSLAEDAQWVFLLTRTSTDVPKHKGLTFFLVPTSAPGFDVRPLSTLSGKRTNVTYYDDVPIGDEHRVGEVDGGWQVMLIALSFERGVAGGESEGVRLFDQATQFVRTATKNGRPAIEHADVRACLARLAIDNEVGGLLSSYAMWKAAQGELPGSEGSMAKLFYSEAYGRAASALLDVCGADGLVARGDAAAPAGGALEHAYRYAPALTIFGGTSEIQKNLIAQRVLGLPRS